MVVLLWLLACLEILVGLGEFVSSRSSVHEVMGAIMMGLGILTVGVAGIQGELRETRRELAEERREALEEEQARAAVDLKRRSGMISSRDRREAEVVRADRGPRVRSGAGRSY